MPRPLRLTDPRIIRASEAVRALELVSEMDLLRLKSLARLHARGLPPDVGWDDLLQEALTRVLTGARTVPAGVGVVPFVAGIMRSLKSEHWRRVARRGLDAERLARRAGGVPELADSTGDPERSVIAHEELSVIGRLFADDPTATRIIEGLSQGLSAEEIRRAGDISKTDYDSARKRIRRCLLREGLTCGKI
jgi:DNA-directed RNA polymerase specialized sigma24 family protein